MELSHPKTRKIFMVKELLNFNELQFKSQKIDRQDIERVDQKVPHFSVISAL